MSKSLNRAQFSQNAAEYGTSTVHAKGHSLTRLVELIEPQETWRVLDIATGGGHVAFAFAPHVAEVVASDLTPKMLEVAQTIAIERNLYNIAFKLADAENLPFDDAEFDLVTCRIAPHHFGNIGAFLGEVSRVLKPNGLFGLVDNIVPNKDKKGKTADYINAFEKLRDPSHNRALPLHEWQTACYNAGIPSQHTETLRKEIDFDPWADRMNVSSENKTRLRAMLIQAPQPVAAFLTPQITGDRITFTLTEGLLIGQKLTDF